MATEGPDTQPGHYLEQEMLDLLANRDGRRRLRARCAAMVAANGAQRLDVERSKALRQVVEAEEKAQEIPEMEALVRRNEAAAARMENPNAADAAREGAESASGLPGESGEVH